jgi:hypothetical protein
VYTISANTTVTQARFIEIIQELHSLEYNNLLKSPLFIFECSRDVALHNAIVLEQFNFDIDRAIQLRQLSLLWIRIQEFFTALRTFGSSSTLVSTKKYFRPWR